jgi:hypothetical protein
MSKTLSTNLLILSCYILFSSVLMKFNSGFPLVCCYLIGGQALVNLVASLLAFFNERNEEGKTYLLSFFLVLIIGYPLCFGAHLISIG